MPYVFVRENSIKYWCTIQGLNHNEVLKIISYPVKENLINALQKHWLTAAGIPTFITACPVVTKWDDYRPFNIPKVLSERYSAPVGMSNLLYLLHFAMMGCPVIKTGITAAVGNCWTSSYKSPS